MEELPMFLKSQMFRLASILNIDTDNMEDMTEENCTDLLDEAVNAIERLKYDMSNQQLEMQQERPKTTSNSIDKKILKKAKTLEDELRLSLNIVEDVSALKAKNFKLMTNLKKEKAQRSVLEDYIASQNKKQTILVQHIEKLMKAIKIESASKVRSLDECRGLQKEQKNLQTKIEKQEKQMATQNRLIRQLSEGSKILEDQLSLMDEKYVELRTKMDINRKQLSDQMTRVRKESDELRVKYSLANGGASLDSLSVRKLQQQHQHQQHQHQQHQHQQQQQQQLATYGSGEQFGFTGTSLDAANTFSQTSQQQHPQQQLAYDQGQLVTSSSGGYLRSSSAQPLRQSNGRMDAETTAWQLQQQQSQQQSQQSKGGSGKDRPVSAFVGGAAKQPVEDSFNVNHTAQFRPGKIRPQTGGGAKMVSTAPAKPVNNFSRATMFSGELSLDRVIKKIDRKQKLSRTDSWADQDLQDLLNG